MAPLASEPRQLLVVLNLAKRKALYTLVVEITAWMRSQLELRQPSDADAEAGAAPLFVSPAPAPDEDGRPVDVSVSQRKTPPSPELVRLRNAALAHFDAWRKDVLGKLKEVLSPPDDAGIVEERRKRTERIARERVEIPSPGENLMDLSDWGPGVDAVAEAKATRARDVARLQSDFHAIPTRLLTIPQDDREEILSCVLLLLLSAGSYSADSRVLAVYLASAFEIPLSRLNTEETEIACSLVETSAEAARKQANPSMSADAEAEKRKQQNQTSRYWKVGLASVAGAAIIGVTGGLAAPMVAGAIGGLMGSVGLGGVASFLGVFWMNGALVGTLFGAYGARMTGEAVDQYAREVEDFRFLPLKDQQRPGSPKSKDEARRLRVTIGVNGWLDSEHDIKAPWRSLGDDTEVFALRYEVKSLMGLGQSLKDLVSSAAWNWVKVEILKRTVLVTLWAALWPVYLLSMASSIDNPFSLAKNRSEKAGEILADALINKVQGERPVTLVGYSLGARVIYSCLRSLAQRRAFGLVDTVVLIGAPIPSNRNHWQMMRSVVSGKVFNVCSENDYLLAFLYRATSIQLGVAGLQSIKDIEGVENIDLSEEVDGHLRYPDIIDKILYRCGFQVVEGAAGPIEFDEGGIKMEDSTAAGATGTLIEFDALAITEPPRPTPEPAAPHLAHSPKLATQPTSPDPERKKQRTTVTRWAPSNNSASQGPLGTEVPPDPLSQLPSSVNRAVVPTPAAEPALGTPKFMPPGPSIPPSAISVPSTPKTTPGVDRSPPAYTPNIAPSKASTPITAPPRGQHFRHGQVDYDDHEDYDEDEEGSFGIKMVDNDGDDLTYLDPSPIED